MLKLYAFARVNKGAHGNTRDLRVLWALEVLDAGTEKEMLKPYANVLAYRARCTERPAWKQTLAAYHARVEAA